MLLLRVFKVSRVFLIDFLVSFLISFLISFLVGFFLFPFLIICVPRALRILTHGEIRLSRGTRRIAEVAVILEPGETVKPGGAGRWTEAGEAAELGAIIEARQAREARTIGIIWNLVIAVVLVVVAEKAESLETSRIGARGWDWSITTAG